MGTEGRSVANSQAAKELRWLSIILKLSPSGAVPASVSVYKNGPEGLTSTELALASHVRCDLASHVRSDFRQKQPRKLTKQELVERGGLPASI